MNTYVATILVYVDAETLRDADAAVDEWFSAAECASENMESGRLVTIDVLNARPVKKNAD